MQKSPKKSNKVLIIADIHHKVEIAQRIIDKHYAEVDQVVLTGDYFDDHGDTPYDAVKTAKWLKDKVLYDEKIIALSGNHDLAVTYPSNWHTMCSGFTVEKSKAVRSILTQLDLDRLRHFYVDYGNNVLFTHAGLTKGLWDNFSIVQAGKKIKAPITLETVEVFLNRATSVAIDCARAGTSFNLLECGWSRHGMYRYGGINWEDVRHFVPIKGINQIFGHTPAYDKPTFITQDTRTGRLRTTSYDQMDAAIGAGGTERCKYSSINLDLDTHLRHYALMENGEIEIKSLGFY